MGDMITVGLTSSITHRFSADDVATYAGLSGDRNPVHLDESAAKRIGFQGRLVHGMLAAGLISRLLGTKLPGPGTIYLSQELRFLKPIYVGDELVAEVEITGRRADKPIFEIATRIRSSGEVAVDGRAVVQLRPI